MAKNWQHRAASFARQNDLTHDPATHTLDLAAEVGELAKAVLLATDYGRRDFCFPSQAEDGLENELGDALYSLLILAEACRIDAGKALDAALDKYERRLKTRGEAGSEPMHDNAVDIETVEQSRSIIEDNLEWEENLTAFQGALGHRFSDRGLLLRALTHSSYANEHADDGIGDNQRLEFLGDAVLDFVAGAWVYRNYPDFDEGRMTRLRASLVCTKTLAQLARQVSVDAVMRLGYGEEEAGGRERDHNLCDAFEAVVGALYLDAGMETARAFFEALARPAADEILAAEADVDAKSRLQEWSQAELGITPRYHIVTERGPDHFKVFEAEVLLGDRVVGQGEGRSKQHAEQAAAQAAWDSIIP